MKRNPASMTKVARGQRPARFQAYTVSQLLETYRDPRAVLLEIAGTDTAKLATTLNCSLADALAERRLCAQAALPYVCQKLPVQVDMRHTRAIVLNMVTEGEYETLQALAEAPTDDNPEDFSIALMPNTPQPTETKTPEPQSPGTEPSGPEKPVTPPVRADRPGGEGSFWLPSVAEHYRQWDQRRVTPLEDKPAGDDRSTWERDGNGTWPPARKP
jgi:hypothetical protein